LKRAAQTWKREATILQNLDHVSKSLTRAVHFPTATYHG
jgi:hypothetical protein